MLIGSREISAFFPGKPCEEANEFCAKDLVLFRVAPALQVYGKTLTKLSRATSIKPRFSNEQFPCGK
jgi:hypothetical protein